MKEYSEKNGSKITAFSSEGSDSTRGLCHYLAAALTMTVYGGQVCPFVETVHILGWFSELLVVFSLFFLLRKPVVSRLVERLPFQQQVLAQFLGEFLMFIAIGLSIAILNKALYGFPQIGSGLKMIVGTVTLGVFAAVDMALAREKHIARVLIERGIDLRLSTTFFPMVRKFTLVSIAICLVSAAVTLLVVLKDLGWMMEDATIDLNTTQHSVFLEISFVTLVFLLHIVNLIQSYGSNLGLALKRENLTLLQIAAGNLAVHVPVTRNDEFGVMARYTNTMIAELSERTREVHEAQDAMIIALASLAETRDNETGAHLRRTQEYVRSLAVHLRRSERFAPMLNDAAIELLYKSAPLHDIGKVGIPDHILRKQGKLTDEEFEVMKRHPLLGVEALKSAAAHLEGNNFLQCAQDLISYHHEKWDGSGYPFGLQGISIPLPGRIMAVADVYDALISERAYKKAFTHAEAVAAIIARKGRHFDPDMVEAFVDIQSEFQKIAEKFAARDVVIRAQ